MNNQFQYFPGPPSLETQLKWTELWVLIALSLALIYALPAAFWGVRLSLSPIKHFPFFVLLVGVLLHAAGANIFHRLERKNAINLSLEAVIPFTILGIFVTAGSIYARYSKDVIENYLTLGLYAIIPLILMYVFKRAFNLELFIDRIIKVWIFVAVVCGIAVLARGYKVQAIHELEYLVLPVVFFAITARSWIKWPSIFFFLAVIALNGKLTGYLVGGLCLVYSLVWLSVRADIENGLFSKGKWRFVIAVLLFSLIAGGVYYGFRELLPSGNIEVRMHQYNIAFDAIAKSPFIGDFFSGESGTIYTESTFSGLIYKINIPTHSDLIDLFRHGGIIGFTLFMWGMEQVLKFSFSGVSSLLPTVSKLNLLKNLAFLELVCITFFLVITFNPVLLQPPLALVFWMSCGLVLASRN